MQVGVVGVNHKLASLSIREALARVCAKHFSMFDPEHAPHHFILLSTCNRTEVYFHSPDLALAHSYILNLLKSADSQEVEQKLYSFFGSCCLHHLSRVTAGLDSAILAETEIQGQVKKAYIRAASQASLPPEFHYIFQKALKVGKTLRQSYWLPAGEMTLEKMVYETGSQFFENKPASLLLVGASEINAKILNYLHSKNLKEIMICNRSNEQGKRIADKFNINFLPWHDRCRWYNYDWIIYGTSSPEPLLQSAHLDQTEKKHLIIDLAVPRNVDPNVGLAPNISLWNIDQINGKVHRTQQKQQKALFSAEMELSAHTNRLIESYQRKTQYLTKAPLPELVSI